MGDSQRANTDFYSLFDIPKAMCKFVTKWNSSPNNNKVETKEEAEFEEKFEAYKKAMNSKQQTNNDEPRGDFHSKSIDDNHLFSGPFLVSRCATKRRSKTPSPRSSYMSNIGSQRSSSPTKISLSRCTSKKISSLSESEGVSNRGSKENSNRGSTSESEGGSNRGSRDGSNGGSKDGGSNRGSKDGGSNRGSTSETEQNPSISRNVSRRNPIIFSQTTAARRKPPPSERKLSCTLEELCLGAVKKIMIKREITSEEGIITVEEEMLSIKLRPGWKKGTKITFEGKGDQKPGYLPADIIFQIDEKRHPLFRREGMDLEIAVKIPLVKALTGCSLSVPIVGRESMNLTFKDTIIYPGFEKVIEGQGMPDPKAEGRRGDLRVKFLVEFPENLSADQRAEAFNILQDCT